MDDSFKKETLIHQVHPTNKLIAQQIDLQIPDATYGDFFNLFLDRAEVQTRHDDMPSQGYVSYKGGKFNKGKPRFKSSSSRNLHQDRGRSTERKRENSGAGGNRSASRTKFNGKCHKCHKYGHMQKDCRSGRRLSFSAKAKDEDEAYIA